MYSGVSFINWIILKSSEVTKNLFFRKELDLLKTSLSPKTWLIHMHQQLLCKHICLSIYVHACILLKQDYLKGLNKNPNIMLISDKIMNYYYKINYDYKIMNKFSKNIKNGSKFLKNRTLSEKWEHSPVLRILEMIIANKWHCCNLFYGISCNLYYSIYWFISIFQHRIYYFNTSIA